MAEAKTRILGKVLKIENGKALTDKKEASFVRCEVGDVLVQDLKTRKVTVKPAKGTETDDTQNTNGAGGDQ